MVDIPQWVQCDKCKAEMCYSCAVKDSSSPYVNFTDKGLNMDSRLMAQIFSDAIAASEAPVMVNGAVYKDHRRNINVSEELLQAMLHAQRELHCKNVSYGSYECYEYTMTGANVDGCLVGEINRLNVGGVTTIGCCCGHGKRQGYIQVTPGSVSRMIELGYEQLPVDENGNGELCFKPKTVLP
jgi:hypothetical protein